MINNRQGGRRRGRGGQRGQNLGGQPGNRQDNRQRGNAAQLLEKYKNMARDAQLGGDRVQTEYYLQFADHYFRVLGESRARFEDHNPRRQHDDDGDGDGDEDEGEDETVEAETEASGDDRDDRSGRSTRGRRPRRDERRDRSDRESQDNRAETRGNGGETIPFDALPPAIGRDEPEGESSEESEPRRPRRRARSQGPSDGDSEVAPAA